MILRPLTCEILFIPNACAYGRNLSYDISIFISGFSGGRPTRRDGELNLAVPDRRIHRCKREHYCIQTRGSDEVLVSLKCNTFVLFNDNVKVGGAANVIGSSEVRGWRPPPLPSPPIVQ